MAVLPDRATGAPTQQPSTRNTPRQAAIRGKALEFATQVLLVTLVPRLLGPAEFGRLTVALAIVTLGAVAISLGSPSAFARFVPAEPEPRRAGLARSMTIQLLPLRGAQLAIAGVICAILVYTGPRFDALDAGLVFVALCAEVAAILAAQVALGLGETWIWSFRISARNLGVLVLVPILAPLAGSAGVLASVTLGFLAGLVFAGSQVMSLVRHAEHDVPVPAGAMQFGRVAGLAILVGQLTYRGPVMAASLLGLSANEVGFAGLAASIAMAIIFAVRELFMVSLPELVESWSRDPTDADRRLRHLGERAQWILTACAAGGVVALNRVLPLVAGDQFAPAAAPMISVLAMLPLLPLPAIGVQAASLRLRPGLPVAIDTVSLVAFAVAAVFLVPRWKAAGASAALLIAIATSAVLTARAIPAVVTPRLLSIGFLGGAGMVAIAVGLRAW